MGTLASPEKVSTRKGAQAKRELYNYGPAPSPLVLGRPPGPVIIYSSRFACTALNVENFPGDVCVPRKSFNV